MNSRIIVSVFLLHPQVSAVPECRHHQGLSFPVLVPPPIVNYWCLLLGARLLIGEQEGLLSSPDPASVIGRDCALNLRGRAFWFPALLPPPTPHGQKWCDWSGRRPVSVPVAAQAELCFVLVQDLGAKRFSCSSSRADGFCLYPSSRINGFLPGSFCGVGALQGRQEGDFYTPYPKSEGFSFYLSPRSSGGKMFVLHFLQ